MKKWKSIWSVALLTFATLLSAVGVHFFRLPNHFSVGGTSGVAILLGELIPGLSAGTITSILSVLFVLIGFVFLGKDLGRRMVYCSVLFALFMQLFELYVPLAAPITDQKMLELLFAAVVPAVGSALLINQHATTGGTEVVALILKKHTALDAGKALLCVDALFTGATFFLFGLEIGLYSTLGLFLKGTLLDTVLEELQRKKAMFIVTEQPEPVLRYIMDHIHRGATVWEANGAYSNSPRRVILTVMGRGQAARLLKQLREIDPNVFILSENSSEIYGKGFTVSNE